jgi:hypothetical protein
MMRAVRDIEAIKALKARYFRLMDGKRWQELQEVFTEDSSFTGASTEPLGRDQFVDAVRTTLAGVVSIHRGSMPEIELVEADYARGTWQFDWVGLDESEASQPEAEIGFGGYGEYREEYRKIDGRWYISSLETTWMRFRPGTMARLGLR